MAVTVYILTIVTLCVIGKVSCQDEPQITKQILPEIKRVGMTGRLNCTVTRQAKNKVYWIFRDKEIIITSDDQVDIDERYNPILDGYHKFEVIKTVEGDLTTYTLIIRRLQLTDAGVYTCRIHYRGTSDHPSKDGIMVVLIPPTVIQSQTTQTRNVVEGENATLSCNATGYPTPNITWIRANGAPLAEPINQFTFRGHHLTLQNVHRRDRGVYRCIADNNVKPPASYDSTLYINFKPFAKPVQTSYGQAQNRLYDIILECRVAGYPDPDFRWYKVVGDGLESVEDDHKHAINVLISHGQDLSISEFWYQLTIINVQANDYGEYVCEGANKLGVHQGRILLYETSECQGPNCPFEGGPAGGSTVTCPVVTTLVSALLAVVLLH